MPKINNKKFYSCAIDKYGTTARGLNWNSTQKQLIRFDIILDILPQEVSTFTLIDAGCGFGDFYHYLKDKNRDVKTYIGIDSLYNMCQIAIKSTNQKIIMADICIDTIPNVDYCICSGALNILTPFETHLFIKNCYNSSTKAFIFNALYGDKESKIYNYLTKEYILNIAEELKVMQVHFYEGYLNNDITVAFVR